MVASHKNSFLWVITLHKIVLVGDDVPQNRSCGVVVPPQTRSCKEKKVKTKCKCGCKARKYFSSFFYEHGEEQEQREQKGEELGVGLMQLDRGGCK